LYSLKFKKGFILFFVAFISVGAIGIPVFKHTCTSENITEHSILVPSNHCLDKDEKAREVDVCCSQEVSLEKEDCCTDEVSELKFSFDIFQKFQLHYFIATQVEELSIFKYLSFSISKEETFHFCDSSPPPLSTLNFLRKNCIWRI
jgi:hypothetical protein